MRILLFLFLFGVTCQFSNAQDSIKMATTTSIENSGLLDVLLPPFAERFDIKVHAIAVGSGKALKLGENGDVDLVFVHSREAEEEFIRKGLGVNRIEVMYNDFVILGPPYDPAGVKMMADATAVLKKLFQNRIPFTSRGDDSGTHRKERSLWRAAEIEPEGSWYIETGQGMGATLTIASEKEAYCLADRGTFIAYKDKIDLIVLFEGDSRLRNTYSIIAVNPATHSHTKYISAMALIDWITSKEAQRIIAEYKKFGQILFYPNSEI